MQWKEFILSIHVPLKQGELRHSSASEKRQCHGYIVGKNIMVHENKTVLMKETLILNIIVENYYSSIVENTGAIVHR